MKQYGRQLPKDADSLIRLAKDQDWHYSKTTAGHHRLVSPRGQVVVYSGTTSDTNSVWDFRSRLKRFGLKPPKNKVKVKERKQVQSNDSTPPEASAAAPMPVKEKGKSTALSNPGEMFAIVKEALQKLDRLEGVSIAEVTSYVTFKTGTNYKKPTVASNLTYYVKKGWVIRAGHGKYRLAHPYEKPPVTVEVSLPSAPAPEPVVATSATEDDDKELARAMDAIVDALSTIDKIVRRANETRKKLRDILGEI